MGSRDRPGCESTRKPVKAAGCGAGKEPSKLPLSIVMDNIPGTSLFSSSYFSTRSQALSWEPQGRAGSLSCLPDVALFGFSLSKLNIQAGDRCGDGGIEL